MMLIMLDTGCRVSAALTLRVRDANFDNPLVQLDGKSRKSALGLSVGSLANVCFATLLSCSLRLTVWYLPHEPGRYRTGATFHGLQSVKRLCRSIGFETPTHTVDAFNHLFTMNYLRRGGSVFHLQKVSDLPNLR
jgi:integrase/recombinase XerD